MKWVGPAVLGIVAITASFALDPRAAIAGIAVFVLISWARSERAAQRRRARRLHRARSERAEARETRLELAGVPRTQMDELTARVALARRLGSNVLDFDTLLDAYVDASIAAHYSVYGYARQCERRDEIAERIRLVACQALLLHREPAGDPIAQRLAILDAEGRP